MAVMFSQRGGIGRAKGCDKSSPRVLRAPKTNMIIGITTITTMIERMKYCRNLVRNFAFVMNSSLLDASQIIRLACQTLIEQGKYQADQEHIDRHRRTISELE